VKVISFYIFPGKHDTGKIKRCRTKRICAVLLF